MRARMPFVRGVPRSASVTAMGNSLGGKSPAGPRRLRGDRRTLRRQSAPLLVRLVPTFSQYPKREARKSLGQSSLTALQSSIPEPLEAIQDEVEPECELGGVVVPLLGDVAADDLDEVGVVAQHGLVLAHL